MNHDDLRVLLDYHYWARDRMLLAAEALTPEQYTRDVESSFRSIRGTLVHIYGADRVWYQRWQGASPGRLLDASALPDVAALRSAWSELEGQYRALLESLGPDGIHRVIDYTLFNGTQGASVFWHMLQHVVNHATYHRGQLTTLLRQVSGKAPAPTDLIAFYRERQARAV